MTFYSLDNESRKYDDQGRIVEIAYDRKNFVDFRLTYPKEWRDAYRYDAKGRPLGWTRHADGKTTEFSREGLIVIEQDVLGRCTKGRAVRYQQEPSKTKGPNPNPLRWLPDDTLVTMTYANDEDFTGRITSKEHAPLEKK